MNRRFVLFAVLLSAFFVCAEQSFAGVGVFFRCSLDRYNLLAALHGQQDALAMTTKQWRVAGVLRNEDGVPISISLATNDEKLGVTVPPRFDVKDGDTVQLVVVSTPFGMEFGPDFTRRLSYAGTWLRITRESEISLSVPTFKDGNEVWAEYTQKEDDTPENIRFYAKEPATLNVNMATLTYRERP
jgi:hypothetical protein